MTIQQISYHGWPDSLLLSNGTVEAVVVPTIGRVMQFRLVGEEDGAFWENRELDGRLPNADSEQDVWLNFGGDKAWPAPQSEWEQRTGRSWPPPLAFDSRPFSATIDGDEAILASPTDPDYGARVVRRIRLAAACPRLEITTEFHKEEGAPIRISVWVITQLPEPERVFALLPERAKFPRGFQQQRGPAPKDLRRDRQLLSLTRDPAEYIKIGTEGTSMLWMNQRLALLISSEHGPGVHPDGGCRTEIYTNPDPQRYVELETMGPLATLSLGALIGGTNSYTLIRRTTTDCIAEARRAFHL